MSKGKVTRAIETAIRGSDEIMVIAAKPMGDNIHPNSITLDNGKYLILKSSAGSSDCYLIRDGADTLYIANLKAGEEMILVVTMASTNQRTLRLKEDAATNNLMVNFGYDTVIKTDNGNLELRPADHVMITDMATADPHVVGALWRSGNDVKISTG